MVADRSGLDNLLSVCQLNPDLCVPGGRADGTLERELHKHGLTRLQSHIILQILRACLEDVENCDEETTISAMNEVQQLSFALERTGDKMKRGQYLRSFIRNLGLGRGNGNGLTKDRYRGMYMYARHGRNNAETKEVENSLKRKKRQAWISMLNTAVRSICAEERCDEDDDYNKKLPATSQY